MYLSSRKYHFSSGNNVFRPIYYICVLIAVNRSVRWLDVPKKTVSGIPVCGLQIPFLISSIMVSRPYQMLYIMGAWKALSESKDSENLNVLTNDHIIRAPVLCEHAWWLAECTWRRIYTQWLKYINRPCGWRKESECSGSLWVLCHWCLIYVLEGSIKVRTEREKEITFGYLYSKVE